MRLTVCITTMNRPDALKDCLVALSCCLPMPSGVVISDDSTETSAVTANQAMVAALPGALWVAGPKRGVCANRNNALRVACLSKDVSHVAFVDDDVQLGPDFIEVAGRTCQAILPVEREKTILTGGNLPPSRFSFRGYFQAAEIPECVDIHAAVFPISLFAVEVWDENIFFGSEDAELCLRALKRGFTIRHIPALRSEDSRPGQGVLAGRVDSGLSKYDVYCQAARLYIGVKRYSSITPNCWKLCGFVTLYFSHLLTYLVRRNGLDQLPLILRTANLKAINNRADSPSKFQMP